MPQGDGTGPRGLGPQTGRGAWLCTTPQKIRRQGTGRGYGVGSNTPQSAGQGQARGMSRGSGRGRGLCRQFPGQGRMMDPVGNTETTETQVLRNRIQVLEEQIKELTRQLDA